jgi:hypothetical protein
MLVSMRSTLETDRNLQELDVSTLQPTMCVSSSSSLAADGSSAMNKRLLESNIALLVAVRRTFKCLLVGHVVVRHDVMWEEGSVGLPVPKLARPKPGMSDSYIQDQPRDGNTPL